MINISDEHSPATFSRRILLTTALGASIAGALAPAAPSQAATRQPSPERRSFYLASTGDNSADGRSPATAWRSLNRLGTALYTGAVTRGDSVLFRRGDTFYGHIEHIPALESTAETPAPLVVDAYGEGDRPVICGYKICDDPTEWKPVGDGLWSLDLTLRSGAYTGNVDSQNVDVGFVKVDGMIHGQKRWSRSELVNDWDFVSNANPFVIRSQENPSLDGRRVEMAVGEHLIASQSGMAVSGLELRGGGAHGVRTPSGGVHNLHLSDLVITEIGGGELFGSPGARFGNGIEIGIGASGVLVENCSVSQCYDVAFTCQGPQTPTARGWRDVVFRGNTAADNTQSFEVWSSGTDRGPGSGFVDCAFVDNVCSNAGGGWGARVRPDNVGKSTHLLFYGMELPSPIDISGNTFRYAAQNYAYFRAGIPPELRLDRNTIELDPTTPLQFGKPFTVAAAPARAAPAGGGRDPRVYAR